MAGRNLGEAFVVISPDASAFLTELTAKISAAVKAVKVPPVTVPVNADTKPALAQLAGLAAQAKTLFDTLTRLRADVNTTTGQAALARLQAQVLATAKQLNSLKANVDASDIANVEARLLGAAAAAEKFNDALSGPVHGPATEQLSRLQDQAGTLLATLASLRADVSTTAGQAALARLQVQVSAIAGQLHSLGSEPELADLEARLLGAAAAAEKFNDALSGPMLGPATRQLAGLQAQAAKLAETLGSLRVDPEDAGAMAKLAALQAQASKLQATLGDISVGGDPARMAGLTAQVLALQAATGKLNDSQKDAAGSTGLWAAALGVLAARFGPGAQGIGWTAAIGGIAGWHIVLDAAIEATIIAATSIAALGAAAAVAWPAIDQVGYATQHSLQAMTALGTDAGPLAGKLDAVQKAMAPQVIEAYGGALSLLTGQTGAFSRVGTQVVTMFDDMIARIDLWARSQKDMGGLLQAGAAFLGQMAKILGTLAQAIDNLLTKDPGVAHFLLDIIQLAASAINWFSRLPAPIVEATLVIHGLYLWGSVLLGIFGPMITGLVGFISAAVGLGKIALGMTALTADATALQKAMALLFAESPVGWLVLGAAALGALAYEGTQADTATKSLIARQEQWLGTLSASQAATSGLAQSMVTLQNAEAATSPAQIMSGWHGLNNILGETGDKVAYFGHEFSQVVQGSALHELGAIGDIIHGVFAPGFAAAGAATVQYQHDIDALNAELNKLTGSYRTLYGEAGNLMRSGYSLQQSFAIMDMAGVKWNDSLALMEQKVKNLIAGYQDMSVGGGILTNSINAMNFATEQQDSKVTQLNSAWDTFFKTVTGGATGFDAFATQAMGLYSSMASGSDTLRVSSGRATISLAATTAAAQKGAPSITGLTTADLQLRDSFVQTASAANTQMDNLTLMASAAGLGARGTALLTQSSKDMVAQMLPAAKGSQEMTAILYTLAQRGGYQGADSFQALAKWVGNTQDPMTNLDKITSQLTVDSANLLKDVQNLSVALGQTLNTAMATAIFTASGGQKTFDAFASAVLQTGANSKDTRDSAVRLAQEIYAMTGNATTAKGEFEAFAMQGLNLTKQQADALWQQSLPALKKAIEDLPSSKTISITMHGDGTYSITGPGQAAPYKVKAAAAGLYIDRGTGPTADDVTVRASKGELIVPAHMVQGGAVDHLRGSIPGFAGGGVVRGYQAGGPVPFTGGLTPPFVAGMYTNFEQQMTTAMTNAMKASVKSAAAAAQAASQAGLGNLPLGAGGPLSASASAAQAFARSILFAYGWTAAQFPSLQALWNQESGWNAYAQNPSSGAAGIPQNIQGWSAYRPGDYQSQIRWGLAYISARYGSPDAAEAHERAYNWYAAGGLVGPRGTVATPAAIRTQLAAQQAQELAGYTGITRTLTAGLAHPRAGSWLHAHAASVKADLASLTARQRSEEANYKSLFTGPGMTGPGLGNLLAALKTEYTTSKDVALVHVIPGMLTRFRGLMEAMEETTEHPFLGAAVAANPLIAPSLPKPGTRQYDTLASIFGFGGGGIVGAAAAAGIPAQWFDRGGYLSPGYTLAYNGTSARELVSPAPPGAVYGPGGASPGEMQIIRRLDRLIALAGSAPAAYSQALNGVAGRAAGRGYYGGGS
jgi:hypothetical protein